MAASIAVLFLLLASAQARESDSGDLHIPCQQGCPGAQVDPKSSQAMPAGCAASAASDLAARWSLPQYPSSWHGSSASAKRWGPHLNKYGYVTGTQVPPACNPVSWSWQRGLAAIKDTIALGINYCHHHAPAYNTPSSVREKCYPSEPGVDNEGCVCNDAGMYKPRPWNGVDCSNFVAFIYNFAFGFYPTSAIGQQACHPQLAPGRLLTGVTTSKLDQLNPLDLVFITVGRKGKTPPVRVSHVVMWTGLTMDPNPSASGPLSKAALLANLPDNQRGSAETCIQEKLAQGQPVYVIADSHHNGPELRPFCGWYIGSFSHARRVIEPNLGLPTNDASIAYWDEASGQCKSLWALQH